MENSSIFIVLCIVMLCGFGYLFLSIRKSRRITNDLRVFLLATLKLAGVADGQLDPFRDQFVTGYVVKYAADYSDAMLPSRRWGMVDAALRFVFGDKITHSRTEEFVNQFDSDEFMAGVDAVIADKDSHLQGYPFNFVNHLRDHKSHANKK